MYLLTKTKGEKDICCADYSEISSSFVDKYQNYIIWTCITVNDNEFEKKKDELIKLNFCFPYLCHKKPCGKKIHLSLALIFNNTIEIDKTQTQNLIHHTLEEYKNRHSCDTYFQITDEVVDFLSKTPFTGHTKNKDGTTTQKEISGILFSSRSVKENNRIIHLVELGKTQNNKEEDASVPFSRINFHSHPKEAYDKHNVCCAWPSNSDYVAVLQISDNTIFHIVCAIEGIYIVSITAYWALKTKKIPTSFVKKNYKISYPKKDKSDEKTIVNYLKKVNSIKFKGHSIFHIKFLEWNNIKNHPFRISYPKDNGNCFVSDEQVKNFKKVN